MSKIIKHCLPGEGTGDESWFERLNKFEQQETRRQVKYKREQLKVKEDGIWSKRPNYQYPHILPQNRLGYVLFPPVAKEIISYLDEEEIVLHSEALNLRSSQVCCLNILFPLKQDLGLAKQVLKSLLPNVSKVECIDFEYTGPAKVTEWLGEPPGGKRGQNRTSIDAAIFWKNGNGKRCITLLEWKYTERSFGSCGGYESDSNKDKDKCRKLDGSSVHPERQCFLTSGTPQTSRYYWEHLADAGISTSRFRDIKGCPFRGPLYQLLRQSLLAAYLRQNNTNIDKVEVVVLYFKNNTSLSKYPRYLAPLLPNREGGIIDVWNSITTNAPPIQHVTIEEVMATADKAITGENTWRRYIKNRYGV
ncbi:hypothetical protein ACFLV0_03705 [Chloroflexota bacterium]